MDHTDEAPLTDEALDRQLEAVFAVEPSPEFIARIRSRLATEPMRPRWPIGWSPVAWSAGGLSLAAAALLVAFLWAPSDDVTQSAVDHAIGTPAVVDVDTVRPELPASGGITGSALAQVPRRARMVSRSRRPTVGAQRSEPAVVIAADEAAALRDLFTKSSEGRIVAAMSPELPAVPGTLAPIAIIEVPPISMNPLAPIEAVGAF
jgi:hypothetical protein